MVKVEFYTEILKGETFSGGQMKIFNHSDLMINSLNINSTKEFLSSVSLFNSLSDELTMNSKEVAITKRNFDNRNTFISFKSKQENYEKA